MRDAFLDLINELLDMENKIITNYHSNPATPFDYYGMQLRDIRTKIDCKNEVYQSLFGEKLEGS